MSQVLIITPFALMFKREALFQKNKMQPEQQNLSVVPQGEAQALLFSWAVLSCSDEMPGDWEKG